MEPKKKQGIEITGMVWAINEYQSPETKKFYYSVDLAVKGVKQMMNVKLPDNYDRSRLIEDAIITMPVSYRVSNFNGRVTPEFHAIV